VATTVQGIAVIANKWRSDQVVITLADLVGALTVLTELLFVLVFAGALLAVVRGRDPLALDVSLVFVTLGQLFVLDIARRLLGSQTLPAPIVMAVILLLLAQPWFTLRLVSRIRRIPRWLLPVTGLAFLGTAVPLAVLGAAIPRPLTLGAVGVFIVTDAVAAAYLALEARRRQGSARIRLALAALATASLAVAILVSTAATGTDAANPPLTRVASILLGLASAMGYAIAFLPPRWLRRIWLSSAVYRHGQGLIASPATEDEARLWQRLVSAAEAISGGGAAVITEDAEGSVRLAAGDGPKAPGTVLAIAPGTVATIGRAAEPAFRRVPLRLPIVDDLAAATQARYAAIIPIAGQKDRAVLVMFSDQASLFGADDAELLEAMAAWSAVLIERRAVLAEQERLSEELSATVSALESASRAKSDFLASMSHELRTPMSAIIGFSDLMRHEPRSGSGIVVPEDWIENIHRSGQHLLGLINDVLDLAKVEAGRLDLNPEEIDLGAAVAESIAGVRPLAQRKALTVESDVEPAIVNADRGRLRQMLYNLLSNAIKFTDAGGLITVRASRVGDEVRVSVADTGVGISAADQAHVFEEFRQVGDPSARQPGTGLGLALTRRLVEAHGGQIGVESTPGRGSIFTIVLSGGSAVAAGSAVTAGEGTASVGRGGMAGDILVIEDDSTAAELLRTYLENDGYSVRIAGDGETGLAEAHALAPAAVLLDIVLPGIDGWEVLRQIKTDEVLRSVPVIIVTVADEQDVGLALGAVDYLVKPVRPEILRERLTRHAFMARVQAGPVRVLAIDDDPAALDMIEATLRPEGFEVIRADGGAAGLQAARDIRPDLVICDLIMPHVDGFGVVASLKADSLTRDMPILILTAHEVSPAEKLLLNGHILGVVDKGEAARVGLREWLAMVVPAREVRFAE
jgi:signal transduction histidine kinase/DNA-binding response OmpR family regulator